jgi:hypothetical protein
MESASVSQTTTKKTEYIDVDEYVEIPSEGRRIWLGIGKIRDSSDLYMERFKRTRSSTTRYVTKKIDSIRFFGGYDLISTDQSIPLSERYLNEIRRQYQCFLSSHRQLYEMVQDFICITGSKMQCIEV